MIRFLFCVVLVLGVAVGRAAEYDVDIEWYRTTDEAKSFGNMLFYGAEFSSENNLPYLVKTIKVSSSNIAIEIDQPQYTLMQEVSSDLIAPIGEELDYKSNVYYSATEPYLKFKVFPFIRKGNQVYRLTSLKIKVETKSNRSSTKSSLLSTNWKSSSVLASGKWVKIKANVRGIYKITYGQLQDWGFNSPDQVALYGNGGYEIPTVNGDITSDDLEQSPIWKGTDGSGNTCIFFYSTGNMKWEYNSATDKFNHSQNVYSTNTYFYLSDNGALKEIETTSGLTDVADYQITSFTDYYLHENENTNLIKSGRQWFGEMFLDGSTNAVSASLTDLITGEPAIIEAVTAGKSTVESSMAVRLNNQSIGSIVYDVSGTSSTSTFANVQSFHYSTNLYTNSVLLSFTFHSDNNSSQAWLDYVKISYPRRLNLYSGQLCFRTMESDTGNNIAEFSLTNATSNTKVWDVTELNNWAEIPASLSGSQLKFKANTTTYKEFVAFNPKGSIPSPTKVSDVENQDLHSSELSELIIVSHPNFISQANELANLHRTHDQMKVTVLTPEKIYNEFSGGLPDPGGLRNFFRFCYDESKQSSSTKLKYILLLGDGTYDNRNILGMNINYLPTFQSENSLGPTRSFVTDDFFVLLDRNENFKDGIIDLGIGRIPARTQDEAQIVVDKIINYIDPETFGDWRNVLTFIGDDGDNNLHMSQAEKLANYVNNNYPSFFANKIYFDSYTEESTPGGDRYPDVTEAINSAVKNGSLILNYTGHANTQSLSDEKVLDIATINNWSNYDKLPIFVTATCEFSRFDDDDMSAGEYILFNPSGGGIGLFSTTRIVYSGGNEDLNREFFNYIFDLDENGENLRLGDVMRLAKAASDTEINKRNFSLLADPALKLAFPKHEVETETINEHAVDLQIDTVGILSSVTISGYLTDREGNRLNDFNGNIVPTVYDKEATLHTQGNGDGSPMEFTSQSNVIYKGLASVENGHFEFTFLVPKDISYKVGKGKIIYYAYDSESDAQGYFDNFYIGGSSGTHISDSDGPVIDLYLNSTNFRSGDQVSANSVLLAYVEDESGINTVGTGIGHDVIAILDNDNSNVYVLNDYYQSDMDSHTSGTVVFPLNDLAEGEHTLSLKIWDVLNNSSETEIWFKVKDQFKIDQVICYPNPVTESANFVFTHNEPDEAMEVQVDIYGTNGGRIDYLIKRVGSNGTESLPLEWNPSGKALNMKPGIYIFRISATTNDGKNADRSGKFIFSR